MIDRIRYKVSLLITALGFWLIAAPVTFGYKDSKMWLSDPISGLLLMAVGVFACTTGKKFFYLSAVVLGFWLQLAPLVFWAPDGVTYLNDTLVGLLVIILAFSLPGMMGSDKEEGGETPEGWSFNPSEWSPRIITVSLAMVCWFLARYMSAYQLGYIDHVYDPFFGDGTTKVITSSVAHMCPVSDAGLGALVYSLEFILGWMGSDRRWRTMPWLAGIFGLMVVPAGVTSILLIVSQPVLVGAWCGLCLTTAACMLVMVLLTIPEMVAVFQLLYQAKKTGKGFWKVFWKGDPMASSAKRAQPIARKGFSRFGFTCPWNLVASILLGAWLMCAPSILGVMHPASDSNFVVGPLVITFSIIAMSEATRSLRFVNLLLAIFLLSAPFWLIGFSSLGTMNNLIVGALIALLSFRKGKVLEQYGKW
ncbi:MAG: vitamin K epoxide reductase family protein [Chlamydiota bacterium]